MARGFIEPILEIVFGDIATGLLPRAQHDDLAAASIRGEKSTGEPALP